MRYEEHKQLRLFDDPPKETYDHKRYASILTATVNGKGVLDIDTVKGCSHGMNSYPNGGCYGECYAYKNARRYGIDFSISVSRRFLDREHRGTILRMIELFPHKWYRIGTSGDPCHDWENTIKVCSSLRYAKKSPVIITKHWKILTDEQIGILKSLNTVFNTSISGMDSDDEFTHRLSQFNRLKVFGARSVLRVVTCKYGTSEWAQTCKNKQDFILSFKPVIDNPLRPSKSNPHVINGDIITQHRIDSIGGGKLVSINSNSAYLGSCSNCIDQCGISLT